MSKNYVKSFSSSYLIIPFTTAGAETCPGLGIEAKGANPSQLGELYLAACVSLIELNAAKVHLHHHQQQSKSFTPININASMT